MTFEQFKKEFKDKIPGWIEKVARSNGWPPVEKLSPATIARTEREIWVLTERLLNGSQPDKPIKGMLPPDYH